MVSAKEQFGGGVVIRILSRQKVISPLYQAIR
jgi:hypothetical protein